jgi:hypothetical protein
MSIGAVQPRTEPQQLYGGNMDKPLSISEIRARAAAFARDWNELLVTEADQLGNFESCHDRNFVRELLGVFGANKESPLVMT